MSGEAANDTNEVKVSAWYAVGVHQAFSAWTDPAKIADWFGPENYRAEVLEMDVKIGGFWRFKMVSQSGDISHHCGRYLAIEPDRLLSFTWQSEEDRDLTEGRETRVSVHFHTEGGGLAGDVGTRMPSHNSGKTSSRIWMVEWSAETGAALGRKTS